MARTSAVTLGFLLLLALIARPIWLGREQWHFGQGTDDGLYLVMAKSIATGQGYRIPSLPGDPYAAKYPPLYPAFLSIAWLIHPDFPASARVGAILQASLVPIFVALLLPALRRFGFSWRRTFLVAALTLVSMQVVLLATMLFSEFLSMCFLLGAILAAESSAQADTQERDAVRWALAAGLLAGLAYLTRNAVLPILAAAPLFFLLKKKPRLAAYFLLISLPLAACWHMWAFTHAPSVQDATNGSYLAEYLRMIRMNGVWSSFLTHLAELSSGVAESVAPGSIGFLGGLPLYHIALAAAVAGCIRIGRRCHWPLYLIYGGLCCAMILLWWGPGVMRLTVSAWPVLLAGIGEEVAHVATLFETTMERSPFWSHKSPVWRTIPRWVLIALGLLTVFRNESFVSNFIQTTMDDERRMRFDDERAFSWIASHKTASTVVLAWKDTTTFLYTGAVASRGLFIEVTPQPPETKASATSFAGLPKDYSRGLLLILRSDLGDRSNDRQLDQLKAAGESLAGSKLEFSSPGAFVYDFPIPR